MTLGIALNHRRHYIRTGREPIARCAKENLNGPGCNQLNAMQLKGLLTAGTRRIEGGSRVRHIYL